MTYDINGVKVEIENIQNNEVNEYAFRKRLFEYSKQLSSISIKNNEVKELYNSMYELTGYRHLKDSLLSDIKELDACFAAGAYKASIILAGSVLEAFLLDWLSEIDGVDYFKTPYYATIINKEGKEKKIKSETLSTYIDRIEEIEHPEWMEQSKKAHIIRIQRNSVHAKVCLKKDLGINDNTCKMVIDYLKDIVKTRLDKIDNTYKKID